MLTESTKTNQNSHISRNIKEKDVQMKENHQIIEYMVVGDDEDCEDCIETTDLTSAQELTARNVNPMKLVTMLRVRFGIGRYEISLSLPRSIKLSRGDRARGEQGGFWTIVSRNKQEISPEVDVRSRRVEEVDEVAGSVMKNQEGDVQMYEIPTLNVDNESKLTGKFMESYRVSHFTSVF
ncbi:hypothetical protein L207DRAFT_523089 [Hyaloscypha variabilis F]|uniref:Uncharacterized protein n=1 Tax=Hyaloscypha variabilis (strain UAMH 11265 / GT02V1 / F) TaxID=1149755 RepID=A0A2J6SAC8_HYAVF|nr:hypothetical protein L207DRAFT_523089 [Hyaloscypha variabilis F]